MPETHADKAVSFPEALLHSRHPWQSDVGTRAPKVGALKRRRSSCRGAVFCSSEGGVGAALSRVPVMWCGIINQRPDPMLRLIFCERPKLGQC